MVRRDACRLERRVDARLLARVVNHDAGCSDACVLWGGIAKQARSRSGAEVFRGPEMQKPAFAGFCEIQDRDPESEIGAQKKTRTSTTVRSPAPEAGVSTNFTIWAFIFSVAAVDVAHYT